MKVGYYKSDMVYIEADSIKDAAEEFADENHQIDELSDMKFQLYVENDGGEMFIVKMYTEYDPRYEVECTTLDV